MQLQGIDCATKLTADLVKGLKGKGVTHIGRYLNEGWKGTSLEEVTLIIDGGIKIISIFESSPTKVSYFTTTQGKSDAQEASKLAKAINQPKGSAIYFTVDYDAAGKDLQAINDYFHALLDNLDKDYIVGAYGSYLVLSFLKDHSNVKYFFQTSAWSHGQVCEFANIYQHPTSTLAGVSVDTDDIKKKDCGSWPEPKKDTYTIKSGDNFWDIENKFSLAHGTLQKLNPKVDPNTLQIGQVINLPDAVKHHKKSTKQYYTVEKNDTLSGIAVKKGITLDKLESLNRGIKPPYVIYPGQRIRVK